MRKTITSAYKKQARLVNRGSHLGISFDPSVSSRAEMWEKRSIHSTVNLQERYITIYFWSGFPMRQIASAHVGGQLLMSEGKSRSHGRSFTNSLTAMSDMQILQHVEGRMMDERQEKIIEMVRERVKLVEWNTCMKGEAG